MRDRDRDRDWSAYRMGVSGGVSAPTPKMLRRSTNYTNATTSFTTVFSFAAAPNTTYLLKLNARQGTGSAIIGLKWKLSGLAAISATAFSTWITNRVWERENYYRFVVGEGEYTPPISSSDYPTGIHYASGRMLITTGAEGGTINVQAAMTNTGTGTVYAGSVCAVYDLTGQAVSTVSGTDKTNADHTTPTVVHTVALPANGYTLIECDWLAYSSTGTTGLAVLLSALPSGATVLRAQIFRSGGSEEAYSSTGVTEVTAATHTTGTTECMRIRMLVHTTGTGGNLDILLAREAAAGAGTVTVGIGSWCVSRSLTPTSVVASPLTITDNTLVTVHSIALEASKAYLLTSLSRPTVAASTTGIDFGWSGIPSGATITSYHMHHADNFVVGKPRGWLITDNARADNTASANPVTAMMHWMDGVVVTDSTGGTLVQQMSSEDTNDVTVEVNSFMHADELELVDAG